MSVVRENDHRSVPAGGDGSVGGSVLFERMVSAKHSSDEFVAAGRPAALTRGARRRLPMAKVVVGRDDAYRPAVTASEVAATVSGELGRVALNFVAQ